jgi:hypothetical protein
MELTLQEITDSDLARIRKVDSYVSVFDVIRVVTGSQQRSDSARHGRGCYEAHPELVCILPRAKMQSRGAVATNLLRASMHKGW